MKKRNRALILLAASATFIFQSGCLTPFDVQSIAQGQLISFVNALLNTVTSDALRGGLGG